ncbi:hypothetical protein [Burkholderia stabilis]|uniref:hypothetical protein n=1 Tax=Burkholderia stabilis TaxID=95485 RepID=UPI0010119D0A|nr:hypothetical protein [Burkholderia stabilis]
MSNEAMPACPVRVMSTSARQAANRFLPPSIFKFIQVCKSTGYAGSIPARIRSAARKVDGMPVGRMGSGCPAVPGGVIGGPSKTGQLKRKLKRIPNE